MASTTSEQTYHGALSIRNRLRAKVRAGKALTIHEVGRITTAHLTIERYEREQAEAQEKKP